MIPVGALLQTWKRMSKKLEIWEDAQSNPCLFEEFKPPVASRGKKQGIVRQQMSLHELLQGS